MAASAAGPRGPGDRGCDLPPERPLHFAEKVLPILHGLGTDSYLVVKKHPSMEAMLLYLGRCCARRVLCPGGCCAGEDGACKARQAAESLHSEPRQNLVVPGKSSSRSRCQPCRFLQRSGQDGALSSTLGLYPGCRAHG